MNEDESTISSSRRDVMKKAAVAGAVVWTAPLVLGVPTAFAAGSAPATTPPAPLKTNFALAGTASMSTNPVNLPSPPPWASNNQAALGIDDNTNGTWQFNGDGITTNSSNSIFHTNDLADDGSGNPFVDPKTGGGQWWQVDLGASHLITEIDLFNRTDSGLQVRASNLVLWVSPDGNPANLVSQGTVGGTSGSWNSTTQAVSITGQLFRLVNAAQPIEYFHLAEVQLWG